MKIGWLLLLVLQVTVGGLALLRFAEQMRAGGGSFAAIQLIIGILFLFGAWQSFRRARGAS